MKKFLDSFIKKDIYRVDENIPDPILIAKKYKDEYIALIAALFAYGNVKAIMKFLNSIDFSLQKDKIQENL